MSVEIPATAIDDGGLTVNTVLGPVHPASLGVVLPHEHVLVDLRRRFVASSIAAEQTLSGAKVDLTTLAWVRFNQERSLDNLHLSDVDTATVELMPFRLNGGGTVVDLTPGHAGRDVPGLLKVSRVTQLHVVMGTGLYLAPYHDRPTVDSPPERLAEMMVGEICAGVGPDQVRAGIIGEMGCSWPLAPTERKALVAAAMASQKTGASISVHPGRHPDAPAEILEVLFGAGASPDRVVICHVDRTLPNLDALLEVAGRGVYVEIDLFGQESSHTRYGPVPLPSDLERIAMLQGLFEHGYGDQTLVSQDIALKHHLQSFGGHGYAHLLQRVLPRMTEAGMDRSVIDAVFTDNPTRLLSLPAKRLV
jgi:phosphotriesterase-related protein